ncbi:MAG: transposase, partial [Candidatus Thiodiazotropha sp. (ex Lucinoma borealis)]|nr:transposase [Candidatus Thiodiazotropha sp. (ex Lucinoma borealis)]
RITRPGEVDRVLDELVSQDWCVYSKPCLNHTGTVVDYLARYTHRIAITNARILAVDESAVVFRYKDYRDKNRQKAMQLSGEEFVRRFLLHVLPKGFTRVRHYGFLAGCCRAKRLVQIREALVQPEPVTDASPAGEITYHCPRCQVGHLRLVALLLPQFLDARRERHR